VKKNLFILPILLMSLFLSSCRIKHDNNIFNEFQKTINNFENYQCISNITVKHDKGDTFYKIKETFVKPDKFKLEIIEPKESKGCIIICDGNKIFLKHPGIEQSVSLENIKTLDKELFVGYFFERLSLCEEPEILEEKIDEDEYIVFELDMTKKNSYRQTQKVWINQKNFTPYKLVILDDNGSINFEVIYEEFNYDAETDEKI